MPSKKEVERFVKSQRSIHLYKKVQSAFREVLSSLPNKEFRELTKNLILMVTHEGTLGQAMHFQPIKGKFKILQLNFPKTIPLLVLKFVVAHELGHVAQERNWRKGDGNKLEEDADMRAANWGFPKTKDIAKWIKEHGDKLGF